MDEVVSAGPTRHARRRRYYVLAIAAVAIIGGGFYYYHKSSRSAEKDEAIRLAASGSPQEATVALRRCLERDPDDAGLLRAMVRAMLRMDAHSVDVEPYTARWCRAEPGNAEAWRKHLEMTADLNRNADAIDSAERVLALDPGDHKIRNTLGRLYFLVGRYDDARRQCLLLLESPQDSPNAILLSLGQIELARGDLAEAARVLDKVLAETPDQQEALIARGMTHSQAGEYSQAIAVFRRVKPRTPEERVALLHNFGQALRLAGMRDQAEKAFDEMMRVQTATLLTQDARHRPDDRSCQVRAAQALLAADRVGEAIDLLQQAIDRLKPNLVMLGLLADCFDRIGQPHLARQVRDQASRLAQPAGSSMQ